MFGKKLVCTIGIAAAALAPATAAHATPRAAVEAGTQVGSEGIIAILIGAATAPAGEHFAHGCPNCPHPAVDVMAQRGHAQIEPTTIEFPNLV
jgi:hypothetical protein